MVADERLSPTRRLLIGVFTLAMAAAGFAAGRIAFRPAEGATQPIQFNHLKHVKDGEMPCSACHEYYETGNHSGLPALAMCQTCHQQALGKTAEEQKLLKLFASDSQVTFKKLFSLPDHAYYSHRRHVVVGGLQCETCHGRIADTTAPPRYPLVRITMATCMDCHTEKNVSRDCTNCHR